MSEYRVRKCDWCQKETDESKAEFLRYANLALWMRDARSPSQTRTLPGLADPSGEMLCSDCQQRLGQALKECRSAARKVMR